MTTEERAMLDKLTKAVRGTLDTVAGSQPLPAIAAAPIAINRLEDTERVLEALLAADLEARTP